ncbi:MAG TPA: M20/M25/M40 family metallo-hydrolase [Anaerolineales bacterium]|nr:M20/M25/M40 family metallo-hydrolase [Anaerolineales bacterium]
MNDLINRVIELAIQIQQIPAPTFDEQHRAEFVHTLFQAEGLDRVSIDGVGNVYALLPGARGRQGKPLIVSAHLDTVFPKEMSLNVNREAERIYGPGLGDNSVGLAALSGLVWALRAHNIELQGDLWLVANVGEEGLGDLRGMKAVVDRFGAGVRAYLVLEGLALGHIYHRAVGVKRYRVTARTQGGHSWSDYGQPSAIHELAKLVVQLSALELPGQPRTTMNVGKITGGTSINVIAPEAWMELDLRSEGEDSLTELVSAAEQLIWSANRPGVSLEAQVIGERPAGEMDVNHPLIKLAEQCLREQGLDPTLISGSTDANVPLSRGYPGIVLGVTTGGGAHTKNEYINIAPVEKGMEQLVRFVSRVWEK